MGRITLLDRPGAAAIPAATVTEMEWAELRARGPVVRADLEFGIRPHAAADQSTAINGMIEQLEADGGGVVQLLPGTYRGHLVLRSGVWLGSAAPMRGGPVTLKGLGTGWVVDTHVDAGGGYTHGMGLQGVDVEGADRDNPATLSGGGIRFGPMAAGGGLLGVHVAWCADQGILMEGPQGHPRGAGSNQIARCYVENVTLDRIRSAYIGAIEDRGIDNQWANIEASTSQSAIEGVVGTGAAHGAGWCVAVHVAAGSTTSEWVSVVGQLSDHGWLIDGQAHRMTACRGDLSFGHDWIIDSTQTDIEGALALNGGRAAANTWDGYLLTSGSLGNRLSGQAIQTGVNTYKHNVEDRSNYSGGNYQNLVDVSGYGYGTAPYKMGSAIPRVQTQYIAPSSGTAWDVAHVRYVQPAYAAPATVTALTGGVKGQELVIVGDGKTTIEHNGTIRTATGSRLLLAADRVYRFVNLANAGNGYWVQEGGRAARKSAPTSGTSWDVSSDVSMVEPAYTVPTTVTVITGGTFGQAISILGDGNVTLERNGTIRTASGASLLLAADRAYRFVNWSTISTGYWVQEG